MTQRRKTLCLLAQTLGGAVFTKRFLRVGWNRPHWIIMQLLGFRRILPRLNLKLHTEDSKYRLTLIGEEAFGGSRRSQPRTKCSRILGVAERTGPSLALPSRLLSPE